jgi:hypothetical protein
MVSGRVFGLLAVTTAGLLLSPGRGRADLLCWWRGKCCPPPSYPACHYWTPELYKVWACFYAPKISQYPAFRYPELPLEIENHPYPCPPVMPADYYSPYLLPLPGSAYTAKSKTAAEMKDGTDAKTTEPTTTPKDGP